MSRAARALRRELVTPEGVDLGITLAGAGTRAGAFTLDAVIMLTAMTIGTVLIVIGALHYGKDAAQPLLIAWLGLFFVLRNLYFILFEGGRKAATPGKRIVKIRVVARDGGALSIDQIIARNLMREIEVFLPLTLLATRSGMGLADTATTLFGVSWALLFTFFPLFNRDRLRIGDLLAGTMVIEAPRRQLLVDLAEMVEPSRYYFSEAQYDAYGIAELQRLESVLRGENEEACWVVARAIAGRIGYTGHIADARPFLITYYEGLRAHLEREVLFGVRRADKTDAR